MKREDFGFHMTRHESALLAAGAFLGLALKSKSNKSRVLFGVLGTITALGDLIQIDTKATDKILSDVNDRMTHWVDNFAKKHGLDDYTI